LSGPQARPGVLQTPIYVPGKREIDGVSAPVKLSSNESPHGPGARALQVYASLASTLCRYPDRGQDELRQAIGRAHRLPTAQLVLGNGSDELIQMVTRAYVGPGDEVILTDNCFAMCRTHAMGQSATIVPAPEPDFRISVDEILTRVTPLTRLVAIASPNNPFGTHLPTSELRRLHAGLPENVILVVDAAYSEYVTDDDYDNGSTLAAEASNVIMTRTLSKLYGLAALRIGWALTAPRVVEAIEHLRMPFNINAVAQSVAAAAVLDSDHAAYVRQYNSRERARVSQAFRELGLQVVPSSANFVLTLFRDGLRNGDRAYEYLLSRGIIPRPVGRAPYNSLRFTIGLESENDTMLAALREYMSGT
jgi:histidinol-phosphate aminotransferase